MALACDVAVIGAGPAGLMAADVLSAAGRGVTVFDQMPSPARKFLMAGRGGLNLTHAEPFDRFVPRYGEVASRLKPILEAFPPSALIGWAEGLGQETFVGSSGRVFPRSLKASPLLRAWLARLARQGVVLKARHTWRGWQDDGTLAFDREGAIVSVRANATVLALGGASWPKLGSTGAWADMLKARGVDVRPFKPANCGFRVAWSAPFQRFEGEPLKGIALSFEGRTARGEAMITRSGIEGGAVYALSAPLRDAIAARGKAVATIDLRPDMSPAALGEKLRRPRGSDSVANFLRKAVALSPAAVNLLREAHGVTLATMPEVLAGQIKDVPLTLIGVQGLERAISTAGGIALDALDEDLMLRAVPNTYAVGEMLDWEAPTGGYLLQATFATAVAAARAIVRHGSGGKASDA